MNNTTHRTIRRLGKLALVASLLPVSTFAQTYTWSGGVSDDWHNGLNWSDGEVPGSSNTAQFDGDSPNKSINVTSPSTVGAINFVSGAGSYSFSGSALTVENATGISNTSGVLQTFGNQVSITGNTGTIQVGAGSEITFSSIFTKTGTTSSGTLTVTGGGVVNFTGTFNHYTLFQTLSASGGSIVNYNTETQNGANIYQASGGRLNLFRTPGSSGNALQLRGTGGEIYLSTAGMSMPMQSGLRFRGDEASGKTLTFGADFAGSDTATFSSTVHLNHSGALANQTYQLSAAADNTLALSGVIQDTNASAAGTTVEIIGAGVVRFAGSSSNTSVTPILISTGTLELAKSGGATAIAGGAVTIGSQGTLRLAASDQIADSTDLIFDGGLFEVGGFDAAFDALTIGGNGGIVDFKEQAGSLLFDSLSAIDGVLTIDGWTPLASIVFTDGSGWDAEALTKVNFTGWGAAVFDSSTGTLYAIPEPATTAALMALVGFAVMVYLRRRS